jgi:hypothetical protein
MKQYPLPEGPIGLTGPVATPQPGTLPLRGDLAHMALAGQHLAAHYVIPAPRTVSSAGAHLLLQADQASEVVRKLPAHTEIEALDYAGDWCWAALGPDGPSGYVLISALEPEAEQ